MAATRPAQGSEPGKGLLIAACVVSAVLVIAAIVSLAHVLRGSVLEIQGDLAAPGAVDTAGAVVSLMPQAEIDRQHALYQPPPPVMANPAAQPPTNQNNAEVMLRREKAKFDQQIVARMKQFVIDNPNRDNREIEEQIIARESGVRTRPMRKSHEKK